MVSRLVITFLPRSKRLLISWLQSPSAVILKPKKIKSATASPYICHEMMGPDAMIFPLVQGRSSGSSQERNVLGPAEPSWHPEEKLSTSARPPATSLGTLPSLPGAFPPPRPQYFRLPALAGTPNLQLPQSSVLWGKKEVWKHQKVANCLCYK